MYNLLITEDEEEIREGVKEWLVSQTDCYNVLTAKNGAIAMEIVERERIDFILLDMQMPVMDGITFLKELQRRDYSRSVIVVLSGFGEFKYAQAAMEYGAIKYILKPITPDDLLKVAGEVKALLDKKAALDMEVKFLREHLSEQMKNDVNIDVLGKIPQMSFDVTEFMMDLRMGLSAEAKSKIERFFRSCEGYTGSNGTDMIYEFVLLVSASLVSVSNEVGVSICGLFSQYPNPLGGDSKIGDLAGTQAWLLTLVDQLTPYISEARGKKAKGIVEQAKKIIGDCYVENITTSYLSEKLYLNKDYLGRLFKVATGFTVNDYLIRVRLERAKELLKEGNFKIYEISQRVGFTDEHYFSTIFKKITGKTPSQYK